MIEVVYKEEKKKPTGNQEFFHIPRNIRQIGEIEDNYKIYIEDYAYQYVDRLSSEMSGGQMAILVGKANWSEGTSYIFIKGALKMNLIDVDCNRIVIRENDWNQASEELEHFFPRQEVVGWFFTMPECEMKITETIYRTHLNYFGGNDKVLFMKDPTDEDEAFFYYDNGKMCHMKGYYLYYERNEPMQEYMLQTQNGNVTTVETEVDDKAVESFRTIIFQKNRKQKNHKEKKPLGLMYGIGAAAAVITLVVGSNFLSSYQHLQETPSQVRQITNQVEDVAGVIEEQYQEEHEEKIPEEADVEEATKEPVQQENTAETTQDTEKESAKERVTATPTPEETPAAAQTKTYMIQPGDTLNNISQVIYGNTDMVRNICSLNGITENDVIYPGETILLP